MDKNYITNGIVGGTTPVLAISASLTLPKTTNLINVKIDGSIFALPATTLGPIPATITIPTASTGSIGVYYNGSTTVYVQGTTFLNTTLVVSPEGTSSTLASIYTTSGLVQETPGKALLGHIIINTGSTTGFSAAGTLTLNAAGFTTTYLDKFGFVGL